MIMAMLPHDTIPTPAGEGMRRALLALVYLSAVAVAVVFSPAVGLLQPHQSIHVHFAAALP